MLAAGAKQVERAERGAAPLRVLHINSGNLYGGVESILVTLARFRDLCPGMEPHYALCHQGRLSSELVAAGACVYPLGPVRISRPWTAWRARRRLREVLKQVDFALVICHMPWSMAVFGPTVQSEGEQLGFWAHAFHQGKGWLERLAARARPDLTIANSHYTEAGLKNLFPDAPCTVIYPPVAMPAEKGSSESRAGLRKQFGADERSVVILQVSRIEACKGHPVHLRALAQLKQHLIPWVCWMAGGAQRPQEQRYLAELIQMARDLGIEDRVHFLGQRSDIAALLNAADIFCQPNQTPDSFGITFVEALWAGVPVITAALGGALEVIDADCGVLVPPEDEDSLAAALKRMIENREFREALGRSGPRRAAQLSEPAGQMKVLYQMVKNSAGLAGKL